MKKPMIAARISRIMIAAVIALLSLINVDAHAANRGRELPRVAAKAPVGPQVPQTPHWVNSSGVPGLPEIARPAALIPSVIPLAPEARQTSGASSNPEVPKQSPTGVGRITDRAAELGHAEPASQDASPDAYWRAAYDGDKPRAGLESTGIVIASPATKIGSLEVLERNHLVSVNDGISGLVAAVMTKTIQTKEALGLRIPYVEVAPVADIPGTHLAVFSQRQVMNTALSRASMYIEEGRMASHSELVSGVRVWTAAGHDLTGPDLARFWKSFRKAKNRFEFPKIFGEDLQIESDFWNFFLLPKLKENPRLVLLGVSADSPHEQIEGTIGHELLHAQFFSNPLFQKTAQKFWKTQLSAKEQSAVKQRLSSSHYDVRNQFLLVNEFQAYTLQPIEMSGWIATLQELYRDRLRRFLKRAGITPIQFRLTKPLTGKSAD